MLLELVARTCHSIEQLEPEREAPVMLEQIQLHRPNLRQEILAKGFPEEHLDSFMLILAAGAVGEIKKSTRIARSMVDATQAVGTPLVVKVGVASVLSYFVHPNDLIPDNTPGGYGFIDDLCLLHAGSINYLKVLPPDVQPGTEFKVIDYYASLMPADVVPKLVQVVHALQALLQRLSQIGALGLQVMLQQLMANPLGTLATPAPTAPSGVVPNFTPVFRPQSPNGGHFSGGAYFEGRNVILPGGGGLINGQVCIPGM